MKIDELLAQYNWLIFGCVGGVLLAELLGGRMKKLWNKHDVLLTVACILVSSAVTRPLAGLLIAYSFTLLLPAYAGALAHVSVWIAYPVLLLLSEFCFYWVHRAAHNPKKHPLLYRLHATHHSAQFMNISVYWRVNVFWSFVVPHAWSLGLALYLGMIEAAALMILTIMLWNIFTHTDYRWDDWLRNNPRTAPLLKAFESVIVTPGLHHTHHGYGRDGKSYRNFAVFFSFYDRLFGTLHHPQGRPANYGLPQPEATWWEQAFYPLVRRRKHRLANQPEAN